MRNKKGFTLVELVIVIAVIAILAGVMIGTFASVVKSAKKSAEQQEMAAARTEQVANDVLEKLKNSEWLGWEDFETNLAKALAEQTSTIEGKIESSTNYTAALREVLDEYVKKAAESNTALTEAQVKYIVESALAKNGTGVTEAQVKAIINNAVSGTSTLTKAQVQAIVEAAQANNLKAGDVKTIVESIVKGYTPTDEEIAALVKANTLSEEDIMRILEATVPVTKKVKASDADKLSEIAAALNSGSTIEFTGAWSTATVEFAANKTLYFRGSNVDTLTINAPAATIGVYNNVKNLDVRAAAMNSVHVYGEIENIAVAQGRVVLENGAKVTGNVTANPEAAASVKIEVSKEVTVPTVVVESTAKGNVEVTNKGAIETVKNDSDTSIVTVATGAGATSPKTEGNVVNESDKDSYKAFTGTFTDSGVYKLTKNITLTTVTVPAGKNVILDLNGYTITGSTDRNVPTFKVEGTMTVKGNGTYNGAKFAQVGAPNNADAVLTIDGGTYNGRVASVSGNYSSNYKGATLVINNGTVDGGDDAGIFAGYGAVVTINGGTIKADSYTLSGNGSGKKSGYDQREYEKTVLTINGGTLKCSVGPVIYHPQQGTLVINGGIVTGESGIEFKAGAAKIDFSVNGGYVKATGTNKTPEQTLDNGFSGWGEAVTVIYSAAYGSETLDINLSGGTFTSANGKNAVGAYYYSNTDDVKDQGDKVLDPTTDSDTLVKYVYEWVKDVPVEITGGTFSSDVSKYVASGYKYDKVTQSVIAK